MPTTTVLIEKRTTPICNVPAIVYGNEPREGGFLLLEENEYNALVEKKDPVLKYVKPFVTSDSFINNLKRYCFWLKGADPSDLKKYPILLDRLQKVKAFRENSLQKAAHAAAETPSLFVSIRQSNNPYLLIPIVSSERRSYIPTGYLEADNICSNAVFMLPNATKYHFSVINSSMHMAWVRAVCGRLKSDFRYSNTIVYNNFIWCENVSDVLLKKMMDAAEGILNIRNNYPTSSLADLYDPLTMPKDLLKAHRANNKLVDEAYGYKGKDDDASRVAFLFKLYEEQTKTLLTESKKAKKVTKKKE